MLCSLIFCLGNVFYSAISLVPSTIGNLKQARYGAMIIARFLVGIGTGTRHTDLFIYRYIFSHLRITRNFFIIQIKYIWYFFMGIANIAPNRLYVAKATKASERMTHISLLSLFQTLGFVLGPAMQSALSPIGEKSEISLDSTFHLDMYAACGWVMLLKIPFQLL